METGGFTVQTFFESVFRFTVRNFADQGRTVVLPGSLRRNMNASIKFILVFILLEPMYTVSYTINGIL